MRMHMVEQDTVVQSHLFRVKVIANAFIDC